MKMKPSVIEELSRTQSKSYQHMMWPTVGVFGYGYTKHFNLTQLVCHFTTYIGCAFMTSISHIISKTDSKICDPLLIFGHRKLPQPHQKESFI